MSIGSSRNEKREPRLPFFIGMYGLFFIAGIRDLFAVDMHFHGALRRLHRVVHGVGVLAVVSNGAFAGSAVDALHFPGHLVAIDLHIGLLTFLVARALFAVSPFALARLHAMRRRRKFHMR